MKRSAETLRKIAFATESLNPGETLSSLPPIDPREFSSHVQWMLDAGLVEARIFKSVDGTPPTAHVARLTWSGCDFIDAARSDSLWVKAKKTVIAPTASWTFDILSEWLKAEIKDGLPSLRTLAE